MFRNSAKNVSVVQEDVAHQETPSPNLQDDELHVEIPVGDVDERSSEVDSADMGNEDNGYQNLGNEDWHEESDGTEHEAGQ